MVESSPLDNDVPIGIEFLDDGLNDISGWVSAWYDLAHIDGHILRAKQQAVSIREHLHIMLRRQVSFALLGQRIDVAEERVNDKDTGGHRCAGKDHQLGVSQASVGKHLELERIVRCLPGPQHIPIHAVGTQIRTARSWRDAAIRCQQQVSRNGCRIRGHLQGGKVRLRQAACCSHE